MVIKVQALDVQSSSAANIKYGLVVENIDKRFFNRGRVKHIFDAELLADLIIVNKTILKYTTMASLATESVTVNNESGIPIEVTYDYVFLSEHVLGIQYLDDKDPDGDA